MFLVKNISEKKSYTVDINHWYSINSLSQYCNWIYSKLKSMKYKEF